MEKTGVNDFSVILVVAVIMQVHEAATADLDGGNLWSDHQRLCLDKIHFP